MKRTKNRHDNLILANDPSITAWGWSVVTPDGVVVDSGIIKTKRSDKKLRIRAGDDRTRRIREINTVIINLIVKYNPKLIVGELPHGSQSASAAISLGVTTAILETVSYCYNKPIEWYSEGDAKVAVFGKGMGNVSKTNMVYAIDKKTNWSASGVKSDDEGIADSIAVFMAAKNVSPVIQLLKNGT